MAASGLMTLVATGGVGVAAAIAVALSLIGRRRRVDVLPSARHDAELAAALRKIQADIEMGQRGY